MASGKRGRCGEASGGRSELESRVGLDGMTGDPQMLVLGARWHQGIRVRKCVTGKNLIGSWPLWAGSLCVNLVGWIHFGPPTVCGLQRFFPFFV